MKLGWPSRAPAPARIAPLAMRHAPRLAEIHGGAFARPWQTQDFERFLAERNLLSDGVFAGSDPKPCGFVLSRRVADEAEILSVAMAAEMRGRGYAGALLLHHLDILSRQGIRMVHLEVEEGNDPALALYRRHGFEEVGRRPGYYAKPDGATAAALTMRRLL